MGRNPIRQATQRKGLSLTDHDGVMRNQEAPPEDGTVVELLVEGEWIAAYWDTQADDMSPYGTPGFADEENRMLILDFDDWRLTDRFFDADAERAREYEELEEGRRLDAAQKRREDRAAARERTEQRRAYLIERYRTLAKEEPKTTNIRPLSRMVAQMESARALAEVGSIMKSFGF